MSIDIETIKEKVDSLRSKGFKSGEIEICQHCGSVRLRAMAKIDKSPAKDKFMLHEISCVECHRIIRAIFVLREENKNGRR